MEEKVEYWMEKYDRDVEQKQHELDVLKVCISCFMLVSKRSVRAGGSIITEGSATLYPLPPHWDPIGGGGCPKPLSQSEAKCEAIDMKMSFYSHTNKTHFPQTLGTRKWPIGGVPFSLYGELVLPRTVC